MVVWGWRCAGGGVAVVVWGFLCEGGVVGVVVLGWRFGVMMWGCGLKVVVCCRILNLMTKLLFITHV